MSDRTSARRRRPCGSDPAGRSGPAILPGRVGGRFVPWGFNYDHDENGRLLEDYWEAEWPKVVADFREMKDLGANVVRVHLQLGKFMNGPAEPNPRSLDRLAKLLALAEQTGLYLDLTGLGCYRKTDVPAWYDALDEPARWAVQARFWEAVATRCAGSPAVFCYDLMNEPVVPGGRREPGEWLGPPFGEFHYVQFITLEQKGRPRPEIARAWVETLVKAIRRVDPPPPDHRRPGRLEPGPAGPDLGIRPCHDRPGGRFPLRPSLPQGREGR